MDVDRPQRLRLVVEPAGCILENCWQMDTSPVRAFDIGDSTSFSWSTNMILDLFVRTRTNEVSIINMLTVLYRMYISIIIHLNRLPYYYKIFKFYLGTFEGTSYPHGLRIDHTRIFYCTTFEGTKVIFILSRLLVGIIDHSPYR